MSNRESAPLVVHALSLYSPDGRSSGYDCVVGRLLHELLHALLVPHTEVSVYRIISEIYDRLKTTRKNRENKRMFRCGNG